MKNFYPAAASSLRIAALATLVGSFAYATPGYAQNMGAPTPTEKGMSHHSAQMSEPIETRIKTLHDKLGITDAQEAKWSDVAQAMRDNEDTIHQLIEARHQNADGMTAIDDLQSYQNIAQAHADGLKKIIPLFQALYSDMPDEQMKNADKVFSTFEGHGKANHKHK